MPLLNRIEQVKNLWGIMLPHIASPEPAWIGRWCEYPDAVINHAIIRASKKFRKNTTKNTPDAEQVWRYVSGIVTSEFERIQKAPDFDRINSENPSHLRTVVENLLRSGRVTPNTTFAELPAILALVDGACDALPINARSYK